ncbi:hypothetical protein KIW84_062608 [Lathyrus oleraceus]|uniref:Uncharacterized protein n=1 Tax=Pisum sativum TaxID=3888 RepID=A0A9D5A8J6_PEA|nr:hypothetical protein KIW84_062608 [Pisum sativum]
MEKEHVIEENYMTDEFDSGPYEDNCEDMHVLIRFNEEKPMAKDFTFKVGMGFSFMNQFNKTIIEFNILNDMEARFSKNDAIRKFFNKSAKAEWIDKMTVDNLKNNNKMKLNELVSNVRLRFATEITGCRAFKARWIARQIIEGGSSKQYSLLWSYEAELRRASEKQIQVKH